MKKVKFDPENNILTDKAGLPIQPLLLVEMIKESLYRFELEFGREAMTEIAFKISMEISDIALKNMKIIDPFLANETVYVQYGDGSYQILLGC
jgi:hypothetical protein